MLTNTLTLYAFCFISVTSESSLITHPGSSESHLHSVSHVELCFAGLQNSRTHQSYNFQIFNVEFTYRTMLYSNTTFS